MPQFEFGSDDWARGVCRLVEQIMKDQVLPEEPYSFSERYLHPPRHLEGHALGWHFEVAGRTLRTGTGPLDDATFSVVAHYDVVAPFVSRPYADDPGVAEEIRDAVLPAVKDGRFATSGDTRPSDIFPQFEQLHDLVARMTVPWTGARRGG